VDTLLAALSAAGIVGLAELGDKSQLTCLLLAARFGARPVILGAILAFAVLDLIAVLVGGALGAALPAFAVRLLAAALFAGFGVQALLQARDGETDDEAVDVGAGSPILATAWLLGLAELGDKTQLAVASLGAVQSPAGTWLGATAALTLTSTVAALAGDAILRRLPRRAVRLAAGIGFLLAAIALAIAALRG
jgi:putative Ca2+/H+ antiporter (TMEM165/GDT1 family)